MTNFGRTEKELMSVATLPGPNLPPKQDDRDDRSGVHLDKPTPRNLLPVAYSLVIGLLAGLFLGDQAIATDHIGFGWVCTAFVGIKAIIEGLNIYSAIRDKRTGHRNNYLYHADYTAACLGMILGYVLVVMR